MGITLVKNKGGTFYTKPAVTPGGWAKVADPDFALRSHPGYALPRIDTAAITGRV
jgi:hypothetical protein